MNADKRYYSVRTGKNPLASMWDLSSLLKLFQNLYVDFCLKSYFAEYFGFYCTDEGEVHGKLGPNIEGVMLRKLRKTNLWPISQECAKYSEDDLFDVIEFLFDCVSKPLNGIYHSHNNCGMHYKTFDAYLGKEEFRNEINALLKDFKGGYELSSEGEILVLPEHGFETLLQADLPTDDPKIKERVDSATSKYRKSRSSLDERRDAIRDLADVLEYLRPQMQSVISKKDDGDLFNLANNFGIRHHNDNQKDDYDKAIWYSWMFYYYLATIHAVQRLLAKSN